MLGSPPFVAATCRSRQIAFFLAGGCLPEVLRSVRLFVRLLTVDPLCGAAAQEEVGQSSAIDPTSNAERARIAADPRMFAACDDDSTVAKITSASGSSPE